MLSKLTLSKFLNPKGFTNYYFLKRKCADVSTGPLDSIRVLDLTRVLAGPFCTMLLGDYGAEIIKIERPETGDDTRQWGPPYVGSESCYYLSINRNKKSVCVNLKTKEGQDIIRKIACKSDVLMENYKPGSLAKYNLDYSSLKIINPRIIYCSITGYGSTGPFSTRAGYDVIAASQGGLLNITGPANGEPVKVGVAITDICTGLYAHAAIMAALIDREKTGKGSKIDCDLLSTRVSTLINIASNYLNANEVATRMGTSHVSIVPYEAFPTSDGYLTVGAGTEKQFKELCQLIDKQSFLEDPRYASNQDRVKHRKSLIEELNSTFKQHPTDYWMKVFDGSGIPFGPINNVKQVFEDPQVKHNKMVVEMAHPTIGSVKLLGPAVKFDSKINYPRSAPPTLGQHTDSVLEELLEFDKDKLVYLRKNKVIY